MDLFKYFFLKRREADISTYDWLEKEVAIDPVGMIKRIDYTVFLLMKKDQREIFAKWSNKVANEYGEILEQYPFFLEDISVLPYSKKEIETALYILIIIASLNKNEKMYEFILTNLIYLSDYEIGRAHV